MFQTLSFQSEFLVEKSCLLSALMVSLIMMFFSVIYDRYRFFFRLPSVLLYKSQRIAAEGSIQVVMPVQVCKI